MVLFPLDQVLKGDIKTLGVRKFFSSIHLFFWIHYFFILSVLAFNLFLEPSAKGRCICGLFASLTTQALSAAHAAVRSCEGKLHVDLELFLLELPSDCNRVLCFQVNVFPREFIHFFHCDQNIEQQSTWSVAKYNAKARTNKVQVYKVKYLFNHSQTAE